MTQLRVVVIGGYSDSLVKFRGQLLSRFVQTGAHVFAMAGDHNSDIERQLAKQNVQFATFPLQRTSVNPFADLKTFFALYQFLRKQKPDLVFSYTIKPVIWGSIAAGFARVPAIYAMVTGLGNQLATGTGNQRMTGKLIGLLYGLAFKNCKAVIFQNSNDVAELKQRSILGRSILHNTEVHIVNGSGVELTEYPFTPLPEGPIVFLTIARFLAAKGIREYAQAARLVKSLHPEVIFRVVGFEESGENAIPVSELEALHNEGVIELIGKVDNAYHELKKCHIYVLASYYGEGLPRTILEALSTGRPVLTTDNVGCREAVEHNYNGLIVEPRSSKALADAMFWFLENESLWTTMARKSRDLAEQKYDVHKVNDEMLRIMRLTDA